MVPIDAALMSLELNVVRIPADGPRRAIHLFGFPERLAGGKDDLVVTPGGPRRRDQIRHLRPGEALRQNEDGTYSIVPADDSKGAPTGTEPKDKQNKD
jgi:hypothetical protein